MKPVVAICWSVLARYVQLACTDSQPHPPAASKRVYGLFLTFFAPHYYGQMSTTPSARANVGEVREEDENGIACTVNHAVAALRAFH